MNRALAHAILEAVDLPQTIALFTKEEINNEEYMWLAPSTIICVDDLILLKFHNGSRIYLLTQSKCDDYTIRVRPDTIIIEGQIEELDKDTLLYILPYIEYTKNPTIKNQLIDKCGENINSLRAKIYYI